MRLYILGICGTFMSGIAVLAKQSGHEVSGADVNVYPPMSDQLREQGIDFIDNYDPIHFPKNIDCVLIGNVISRGNPAIEYVLNKQLPYSSGPEWLANHILKNRWVLGISGTHGKTTTASLLSWILSHSGCDTGFLIGGIPENFGISARLGKAPFFVIEADEYDTAFFDKRPKFMHYHPKTIIINNLEFDHADIFPDLNAIKQQFHYLLRTIPANGLVICPKADVNIQTVINKGCWTPITQFGIREGAWQAEHLEPDGSAFKIFYQDKFLGTVNWQLLGIHNMHNALAAFAAAHHAGVPSQQIISALNTFKNVKRRLEIKGKAKEIVVYDDFAHHPTAIATTLAGLRAKIGKSARIIAILEFGSYTMRSGVHKATLEAALYDADVIACKNTQTDWGLKTILNAFRQTTYLFDNVENLIQKLVPHLKRGDHIVVMSNSGFDGIHLKLLQAIENN